MKMDVWNILPMNTTSTTSKSLSNKLLKKKIKCSLLCKKRAHYRESLVLKKELTSNYHKSILNTCVIVRILACLMSKFPTHHKNFQLSKSWVLPTFTNRNCHSLFIVNLCRIDLEHEQMLPGPSMVAWGPKLVAMVWATILLMQVWTKQTLARRRIS